jgi:anti-sigma-K factor RskA
MTCDERKELMLPYLADALDAAEVAALREHLSGGCPRCAGSLAEAQAVMAQLAHAAPPLHAPAKAKDRLMERVDSVLAYAPRQGAAGAKDVISPQARWRRIGPIGSAVAASLVAALLAASIVYMSMYPTTRLVSAEEVEVIAMGGGEKQPLAQGRIFADSARHRWHLYAFHLKPPPPGRTYQMWLVTSDQRKLPAGTFGVDSRGQGSLVAALPPNEAPVLAALVTDEPAGGSKEPTGIVHLRSVTD